MLSINEKESIIQTLQTNLRGDGRQLDEFRHATVKFGELSPNGDSSSCYVSLGQSQALATANVELVQPYPDRPHEGLLTIGTVISPMAAEEEQLNRLQRTKEQAKAGVIIEQAIRDTKAVDLESLCVVAGKKVWSVKLDIYITNHCGNVVDSGCLAALGALVKLRKPEVSVIGETVTVFSAEEREPVPLAIQHLPLCVTFGFYRVVNPEGKETVYIVSDPNDREEKVLQGTFTIIVNAFGEVCGIHKQGWPPIGNDEIIYCAKLAASKSKEWSHLINT